MGFRHGCRRHPALGLPDKRKSYYDEEYLPKKLDRVDEAGNLYFDGSTFPWKLADDFAEDRRWGYPKWKVVLGSWPEKAAESARIVTD